MTDYDAAIGAARRAMDRAKWAHWEAEHGESTPAALEAAKAAEAAGDALVALVKAIGALREHVLHRAFRQPGYCAACHEVGPCEVEAEADRLAAPYLEVKT